VDQYIADVKHIPKDPGRKLRSSKAGGDADIKDEGTGDNTSKVNPAKKHSVSAFTTRAAQGLSGSMKPKRQLSEASESEGPPEAKKSKNSGRSSKVKGPPPVTLAADPLPPPVAFAALSSEHKSDKKQDKNDKKTLYKQKLHKRRGALRMGRTLASPSSFWRVDFR